MEKINSALSEAIILPDGGVGLNHNLNLTTTTVATSTAASDTLYPYIVFVKVVLFLWDLSGLVVNGFGIDLMWHGIEINHAVYSLLLQDIVLCWLSSAFWCILNWIWWSSAGML